MEEQQAQSHESLAHRHQHSAESIITLLEWLVVAFILALLFMAFAMQAFQIPTGSMAETLRGAHYSIRCIRCGHRFDVGNDAVSHQSPRCPNCSYTEPQHKLGRAKNGDRIFVLKSIYQFFEPKRWDVIVFKNPTNPLDNYIKRLIALPEETVQLINGDVYIDGKIKRKPANVQKELWMPIFLQDQQPLAAADYFNQTDTQSKPWVTPFINEPNSAWNTDDQTVYTLKAPSEYQHSLVYVPRDNDDFRAFYGYNESSGHSFKPMVSDLMVRFYARGNDPEGYIGASLEKYGVHYAARVEFRGALVFTKTVNGQTTQLRPPMLSAIKPIGNFEKFEFANVDQQLVLRWGDKRFTYDLSQDEDFKPIEAHYEKAPAVRLFAMGSAQIKHVGLYRDTFYMGKEAIAIRATEENPFTLDKDEFFVCGDNSNNSLDGRLWSVPGIGNNSHYYPVGVVPRDYLMGKAVLIYWSQAFQAFGNSPLIVPNFTNLGAISGGSETNY